MGGFGSTRWRGNAPRVTREEVRTRLRSSWLPKELHSDSREAHGVLKRNGRPKMRCEFSAAVNGLRLLTIRYRLAWAPSHTTSESIVIESVPQPLAGSRWWFRCPGCNTRRAELLLPPNRDRFRCRRCANVSYLSQRLRTHQRLDLRARRLGRRIDWNRDDDAEVPPDRPRGMHRKTFERHLAAIEEVEEKREEDFLLFLRRLLKR